MKKTTFLKTVLLLCALIVGSTSVWGNLKTSTLTFTAKCNGSGTADDGIAWTITSDGTESTYDATSGIHYGTNSASVTNLILTSAAFNSSYTITKVVVNARDAQANAAITVKVGTTSFNTGSPASVSATATNTSTNYEFTGSAAGAAIEVKLNRNSKMTKALYVKSIEVTYDDNKSLTEPTISFPNASYTTTLGDTFTEPVLTCNSDGAKTYSSSNTDVATVNASTGEITIKKVGNTIITVDVAETATYAAGSASYNLKVQGVIEDGEFNFANFQDYGSNLTPGDTYYTEDATWTAGNITLKTTGRYRWFIASSGKPDLRLYGNTPNSAMVVTAPDGYVITKIDGVKSSLTPSAGTISSSIWSGKAQSVTFTFAATSGSVTITQLSVTYRLASETTIAATMGAGSYMTYCYNDAALSFDDLEAYVVSEVGDGNVTLTQVTKAPAGTPVILKGSAGDKTFTIEDTPDAVATNQLRVSTGTITTTSSYTIYALAKKNDVVGFYKVQEGVQVPAGKCYIRVNNSSAPEFLGFNFGETTAIRGIDNGEFSLRECGVARSMENGVFNLNGQRVAQPLKGLYIVNGRKVVIK